MKIHLPSLGIGIGITIAAMMGFFLIYGQDTVMKASSPEDTHNSSQKTGVNFLTSNLSPVLGSESAPITVIEFGDYQCFYCNNFFHNTESDIVKNYVDTGKVKMYFKDFTIIGQDSVTAANAAHCAQEQGKFWEYHDILYTNWSGENTGWISATNLAQFSKQLGLNQDEFNQCVSQSKYIPIIRDSVSDANNLGLTGTPDFFIIGPDNSVTKVVGAQPYSVFDEIFKSKLQS
ncbi:MAG TPA: thioredoxin domain-containing protein [Candidatus Nitrosotalea sp.]|nr:thioredoxin domain-containing protein [Candidatus Nitrosotalea sp.]